ncbi:LptM family lipoprotein [Butyrivibrio sp. AC2005]|uniref:LptM family lipoprotein n=1 Tax=Butyrivibrio sp. AC2005 TaxID=1280672 RepID=UPI00040651B9|nr:hypothetical protein [Butyrivibrio sp. AC2005]
MKNKFWALILMGTISLSLSACGNNASLISQQIPDAEPATTKTIEDTEVARSAMPEAAEEEAAAAGIYDPAKQIGANAPDSSAETNELSNDFIENAAKEVSPSIDITDCDTFTQIVDQKLENGMGYANVTVTGTDLLLVSSATYDDLEGRMAAIDATAFEYKDGVVVEIGALCSGGTAYPFTMNNGYLYSGSNHWICKYAVANDKLSIMEKAGVIYDENGNGTYFYESDDGGDYSNMDSAEAEKIYKELIDEMMNGEIVNFQPVTK